jgi:hypothetical protein
MDANFTFVCWNVKPPFTDPQTVEPWWLGRRAAMESGSNMESKAASAGDEAMTTSPVPELVAAAAVGGATGGDDEVVPPVAGANRNKTSFHLSLRNTIGCVQNDF